MTRRITLAAAATLALAALPACGGSSNDTRAQIEDVLNAFTGAVAAGDTRTACAQLTPAARKLADEAKLEDAAGCEAVLRKITSMLSEEEAEAFDELVVRRVHVDGDRAEVADEDVVLPAALTPELNDRPAVFRRIDGRWLLEDLG